MRRNCNLELRLFPPYDSDHRPRMEEEGSETPTQQYHHHRQHQQPLTIFYDGQIWVSDVTELQARSILMIANKEMEERVRTPTGSEAYSPTLQSPQTLLSPGTSLSMKRSLQSFLQRGRIGFKKHPHNVTSEG